MWNLVTSALGLIAEPIKQYQQRKTLKVAQQFELQRIEFEAKKDKAHAVLELAKKGQQMDYDLDKIAMQNMAKSWKDELVLIVFLTPMLMAFIPATAQYALAGFDIIAQMPHWYVAIIIGMVVVIYGLRGLLKAYLQKNLGVKSMVKGQKNGF